VIDSRCEVSVKTLPRILLVSFVAGALGEVLVFHLFWWQTTSCFGEFAVTDPISSLEWYGESSTSLLKLYGLIGACVSIACCGGLIAFKLYVKAATRGTVKECISQLAIEEANWKEHRLKVVAEASKPNSEKINQDADGELEPVGTKCQPQITYVKGAANDKVSDESSAHKQEEHQREPDRSAAVSTDKAEVPANPVSQAKRPIVWRSEGASKEKPPEVRGGVMADDQEGQDAAADPMGGVQLPHTVANPSSDTEPS